MKITGRFVINRYGVRNDMLMSRGEARIQEALIGMVEGVKPPGTEVFVGESRGRNGRLVIWLFDRSVSTFSNPRGRAAERRWKKSQLQQALARIGGKFRRVRGRSFP